MVPAVLGGGKRRRCVRQRVARLITGCCAGDAGEPAVTRALPELSPYQRLR